jgi:hypothetical protein
LSRSDAWAKIGDSQLKFTMEGISHPLDRHGVQHTRVHARPQPILKGVNARLRGRWTGVNALKNALLRGNDGPAGSGPKIGLSQVARVIEDSRRLRMANA